MRGPPRRIQKSKTRQLRIPLLSSRFFKTGALKATLLQTWCEPANPADTQPPPFCRDKGDRTSVAQRPKSSERSNLGQSELCRQKRASRQASQPAERACYRTREEDCQATFFSDNHCRDVDASSEELSAMFIDALNGLDQTA